MSLERTKIKRDQEKVNSSKRNKRYFWYGAFAILIVSGYAGFLIWRTWPINVWSIGNAGVFGDSFGVVTCLFTAFAFIGVLVNIDMQREGMKKQQENIDTQQFESNFFQMLNHLNEITKDITFDWIKDERLTGRLALNHMTLNLVNNYGLDDIELDELHERKFEIEERYEHFWDRNGEILSHYFRWIYHLMMYVHSADLVDRRFYIKLICAQLSNQELVLLFYNASFKRGAKLKSLMLEYDIMSNVEKEQLAHTTHCLLIANIRFWGDHKL